MGVTLKQIAEMAGVHKSTVDKVLHNRPGVSDEVRQKIRALLDEYEYESNPLAKALNYQKKKLPIAVVLPDVDARGELLAGIELMQRDCASFNLDVQFHIIPYPDAQGQAACLQSLLRENIAGVVVTPIEHESVREALRALDAARIPVVILHSDLEGAPRLCFVGQDVRQAGGAAARMMELLLGGAGQIGVISSQDTLAAVHAREDGFQKRLAGSRLTLHPTTYIRETPEDAYRAARALLAQAPLDGLFITCGCVPDVCRAVRDSGKAGRLPVVCFERYPDIIRLVRQGEIACTISSSLVEQGRRAMRALFEWLVYARRPEQEALYVANDILIPENI